MVVVFYKDTFDTDVVVLIVVIGCSSVFVYGKTVKRFLLDMK